MLPGDITDELYADENIQLHRSPHPVAYLEHYLGGVLITAVSLFFMFWLPGKMSAFIDPQPVQLVFGIAAAFGIVYILGADVYRRAHDYYVTDKRVVESYNLFSKRLESAPYNRVQDVASYQSFVERLFDIGAVGVNTAGSEAKEIRLEGIREPSMVKQVIMQYLSRDGSGGGV